MSQNLSDSAKSFALQSLSSVTDAGPAARKWFDANGNDEALMSGIAIEVGQAYVTGSISFSAANSFMNGLMVMAKWEAPKTFWIIYIALEDFEIEENPGIEAVKHVKSALASTQ